MFVKFHAPYFINGACEYEAHKPVSVPDDLARVEIAKGLAEIIAEPETPQAAEKPHKRKK